jgi:hypothetical protein
MDMALGNEKNHGRDAAQKHEKKGDSGHGGYSFPDG